MASRKIITKWILEWHKTGVYTFLFFILIYGWSFGKWIFCKSLPQCIVIWGKSKYKIPDTFVFFAALFSISPIIYCDVFFQYRQTVAILFVLYMRINLWICFLHCVTYRTESKYNPHVNGIRRLHMYGDVYVKLIEMLLGNKILYYK